MWRGRRGCREEIGKGGCYLRSAVKGEREDVGLGLGKERCRACRHGETPDRVSNL